MFGAIIGDIIGSRFEFMATQETEINLFHPACVFTDDTICSLAVTTATEFLIDHNIVVSDLKANYEEEFENETNINLHNLALKIYAKHLRAECRKHPYAGYGAQFANWVQDKTRGPYDSLGNGCLMRVSGVPFLSKSLEEALFYSKHSSLVTHDHVDSIKSVEQFVKLIWIAKKWNNDADSLKLTLKNVCANLNLNYLTVKEYHDIGGFHILAPDTLQRAIACFMEANSYEETIKNVLYIGSDVDTTGAIAGTLAEYAYGIPVDFLEKTLQYFDHKDFYMLKTFAKCYKENIELGQLAQKNMFSEEHKAFYAKVINMKLEDPTASFDPLEDISKKDYYSEADRALKAQNDSFIKRFFENLTNKK